jgi:hypothetical protein
MFQTIRTSSEPSRPRQVLWGGTLIEAVRDHALMGWKPDSDLLVPAAAERGLLAGPEPELERQLYALGILTFYEDGCRRWCYHESAPGIEAPGSYGACGPPEIKYYMHRKTMWLDGYEDWTGEKGVVSVKWMGGHTGAEQCGLTPAQLYPARTARIGGHEFFVPADPEGVLEALYGVGWRGVTGWKTWSNGFCARPSRG